MRVLGEEVEHFHNPSSSFLRKQEPRRYLKQNNFSTVEKKFIENFKKGCIRSECVVFPGFLLAQE